MPVFQQPHHIVVRQAVLFRVKRLCLQVRTELQQPAVIKAHPDVALRIFLYGVDVFGKDLFHRPAVEQVQAFGGARPAAAPRILEKVPDGQAGGLPRQRRIFRRIQFRAFPPHYVQPGAGTDPEAAFCIFHQRGDLAGIRVGVLPVVKISFKMPRAFFSSRSIRRHGYRPRCCGPRPPTPLLQDWSRESRHRRACAGNRYKRRFRGCNNSARRLRY